MAKGYGRLAPVTQEGRLFCILFVMVGVPLTLAVVTAIIDYVIHRYYRQLDWLEYSYTHLVVVVGAVVVLFLLLPDAAFFVWLSEGEWTILDAIYFVVISAYTGNINCPPSKQL